MDPDAEAQQAASKILKTSFIVIVFTTCNSFHHKTISQKKIIIQTNAAAVVKRVEKPVEEPAVQKKQKKKVYLTFDDGPNKGTRKVMNIINEEKVPVTMFIIGEQIYGSREQKATYDSILQCRFIELANHSFTHGHHKYVQFYSVPDSAVKDFVRCADSLHLTSGVIRTPGRNIWRTGNISYTDIKTSTIAADSLQQNGFNVIGWDLEWHFNNSMELQCSGDDLLIQIDSVFAQNKTKITDHLVLLAHDQVYTDAADSTQLHKFIKAIKAKDEYDLEFISNYPTITKQ